uniref:BTB domain-containing protein n=1 Tax=Strongyloides venezuelensis TaxID=75913 RepID=A0A0K0FP62_STRVS
MKEFRCPQLNSDLLRIDVATFYHPIPRDCSSDCSSKPAYTKKVVYNRDWLILLDWSAAYKVTPLLYNPHCYPNGTFVIDGDVPVSLLRDRITFKSNYDYLIKKGTPKISFLPFLGRDNDVYMTIEEDEFSMILTLFLMRNGTEYDDSTHQENEEFYDIATESKLKVKDIDINKAQKILHNMYYEGMEMIIESTEMEWHRLCEVATYGEGQFYEEVMVNDE